MSKMLLNIFAVVAPICIFIGVAVAIKWICIGISKAYESAKTAISDYIADFKDENYTKFRRDVDWMRHSENHLKKRVEELMVEVGRLKEKADRIWRMSEARHEVDDCIKMGGAPDLGTVLKAGGEPDWMISEIRSGVLFAFAAEDILRRIVKGKTVSISEVKEALKQYDDFWETKEKKDELKRRGRRGNSHVQSLKGK